MAMIGGTFWCSMSSSHSRNPRSSSKKARSVVIRSEGSKVDVVDLVAQEAPTLAWRAPTSRTGGS